MNKSRFIAFVITAGALFGQNTADQDRNVSWRKIVPNILEDQKHIWTFPARLAQGKDWVGTGIVVGGTAGLAAADPHISGYIRTQGTFNDSHIGLSGVLSAGVMAAPPVAMLAVGMLRHDEYMSKTALLVGEAVADVQVIQVVFKGATGRLRPADVPQGNLSDSWSDRTGFDRFRSSFPSGHALTAFAVATVISHRYKQHRWVPILAYGVATAIGCSRVAQGAHFASDVFMGSALGYTVARFTVLQNRE